MLPVVEYVGKSEISFNIRLNNHRNDIKNPNAIEACKHFNNNEDNSVNMANL